MLERVWRKGNPSTLILERTLLEESICLFFSGGKSLLYFELLAFTKSILHWWKILAAAPGNHCSILFLQVVIFRFHI